MKTLRFSKVLMIGCSLGLLSSCLPSKTNVKRSTSSNTSPATAITPTPTPSPTGTTNTGSGSSGTSGGGTSVDQSCYAKGTGPESVEYYTTPSIVQKGLPTGTVAWSSNKDSRLTSEQNLFATDSRFNIRVLAFPSPGKGTFPNSVICKYAAVPYTKLQVKVRLRQPGSTSYYKQYVFDNIKTDSCSNVFEFRPPPSTQPWVVEVLDVKWDYSCIAYGPYTDVPQCPWDNVWENDCYEIALQWSTDYTRDIPH